MKFTTCAETQPYSKFLAEWYGTISFSFQDFKTPRLYYKFSREYFYKCPGTANSCS